MESTKDKSDCEAKYTYTIFDNRSRRETGYDAPEMLPEVASQQRFLETLGIVCMIATVNEMYNFLESEYPQALLYLHVEPAAQTVQLTAEG